jgi:hypothetical protein
MKLKLLLTFIIFLAVILHTGKAYAASVTHDFGGNGSGCVAGTISGSIDYLRFNDTSAPTGGYIAVYGGNGSIFLFANHYGAYNNTGYTWTSGQNIKVCFNTSTLIWTFFANGSELGTALDDGTGINTGTITGIYDDSNNLAGITYSEWTEPTPTPTPTPTPSPTPTPTPTPTPSPTPTPTPTPTIQQGIAGQWNTFSIMNTNLNSYLYLQGGSSLNSTTGYIGEFQWQGNDLFHYADMNDYTGYREAIPVWVNNDGAIEVSTVPNNYQYGAGSTTMFDVPQGSGIPTGNGEVISADVQVTLKAKYFNSTFRIWVANTSGAQPLVTTNPTLVYESAIADTDNFQWHTININIPDSVFHFEENTRNYGIEIDAGSTAFRGGDAEFDLQSIKIRFNTTDGIFSTIRTTSTPTETVITRATWSIGHWNCGAIQSVCDSITGSIDGVVNGAIDNFALDNSAMAAVITHFQTTLAGKAPFGYIMQFAGANFNVEDRTLENGTTFSFSNPMKLIDFAGATGTHYAVIPSVPATIDFTWPAIMTDTIIPLAKQLSQVVFLMFFIGYILFWVFRLGAKL